ncbi:MAG: PorT family protein [Bacteroidales bacterium]|nr:PorT family protein [Bacteroidales bacterium]
MKMVVKLFFTLFFSLCMVMNSNAQTYKLENLPTFDHHLIHFGFILGANQMNFSLKRKPYNPQLDSVKSIIPYPQQGFQITIISDLRLGNNLNLRFYPGLSFGERQIHYSVYFSSDDSLHKIIKKAESAFLDFPFLLKYKTDRIVNFRAYVLLGTKYSYDLLSQSKKKQMDEEIIKLTPHDLTIDGGVGVEFYLEYFKFGIELRTSYGLFNILKQENTIFTDHIEYLRSKMTWLCFTFE